MIILFFLLFSQNRFHSFSFRETEGKEENGEEKKTKEEEEEKEKGEEWEERRQWKRPFILSDLL